MSKKVGTPAPPRIAEKLLLRFLRTDIAEEVLGDLEEKFYVVAERKSLFRARLNYWYQVLNYLRPFAIKGLRSPLQRFLNSNSTIMLRHNILLSFRHFSRHKSSFLINLVGLSTGLACTLLIYLWVSDELSVDKFHVKASRLYQVMENVEKADGIATQSSTPGILAKALAEEIPGIEYGVVVSSPDWFSKFTLSTNDKTLKATGQYVGEDYFNIFSYDLITGDKNKVLSDKNSIVISEELAFTLFNTTENLLGKTLEFEHEKLFVISGIFKGPPSNSSCQFDFALSFDALGRFSNWHNHGPATYIVLEEGVSIEQVKAKVSDFMKSKLEESDVTLFLKPYAEMYLYGRYENGVQAGGRIEYVRLFSLIAIFILTLACINFINLSTAKASGRLKEIGVKKVIGASRKVLVFQYLTEAILLAFLSMLIAVALVIFFLPQFNIITDKKLVLSLDLSFILCLLAIVLGTGLVSGSYPALYLSRFQPASVLKGKLNTSTGEVWIRKGLVVFQFALSVIFIVAMTVIYQQLRFVQAKNQGYNKDNIVYFKREGKVKENPETFLSELKNVPGVISASSIGGSIIGGYYAEDDLHWEGKNPDDKITFDMQPVNYGLIETLGIEVKEGRSFSKNFKSDHSKLIFNEAAIKVMGLTDPVGKAIRLWGSNWEIGGVVSDFHFQSLHQKVKPFFFMLDPNNTRYIMVKIEGGKETQVIEDIEAFYQEFNPGFFFDYRFLDQDFQALYASEKRVRSLSGYFAGFAVLISCLGLFGLTSFTTERRKKEIGIRKILGSGQWGIIYLLSSDFTKMVLAAVTIALPVSYFFATEWLQNFAYAINLEWWFFTTAGLAALFIAWLTVALQTFKAASVNPAECLRNE